MTLGTKSHFDLRMTWARVRSLMLLVLAVAVFPSIFLLTACGGGKTGILPSMTVKAPELEGGADWLNTPKPLKLADLKGKIVLLDFWNLSCVNCFHTVPILRELEKRYANDIVIIGIHTPKYSSEKEAKPLRDAVLRMEMDHPVVNDAENEIWTAYGVKGYPTLVLIDPNGGLVKQIVGERSYPQLDKLVGGLVEQYKASKQLDEKPLALKPKSSAVAETSALYFPEKVCLDSKRKALCIADSGHNRIVITDMSGRLLSTIGTGKIGSSDGAYDRCQFHHPRGMVVAGDYLYVADTQNQRLRKIDLNKKLVSTISGDGILTDILAPPDLGDASRARLNSPWDLAIGKNRLYITMAGSHQLYYLDFPSNKLFVFAGTGDEGLRDGLLLDSDLAQPSGIAYSDDKVYFTDSESNSIRVADTETKRGKVKTITGLGLDDFGDADGTTAKALLQHPLGLAITGQKLYVADTLNNKIKLIDLNSKLVSTVWGSGKPGNSVGEYPQFNEPNGIAIEGNKIFIADTNNHAIKVGDLKSGKVSAFQITGLEPSNRRN